MSKPPVPFPIFESSGALTLTSLGGLSGKTISGDDVIKDGWSDIGGNNIQLFVQQLGTWGDDDDPFPRSTKVSWVQSGLPINTYVKVTIGVGWNYMDFGASGKPIGLYVNDVLFAPGTTPSGTITANNGTVVGYGVTNSAGELNLALGVENVTPSLDILIQFGGNIAVGLSSAEFADIITDSATLWQRGNPTSVTRGSLSFEPNEVWENFDFPGKTMPVVGLDECVSMRPVIKGSMMMTGEDQFNMYRPGGSWANGDSAGGIVAAGIRTFTPGAFRSVLSEGAYLQNLIVIWKRQRLDYVAVEFLFALCTHFGISAQDGDEGLIPVEFEARQPNEGTPLTSIPYLIHILPSTFAFAEGSES
jgi:hypothetical protein